MQRLLNTSEEFQVKVVSQDQRDMHSGMLFIGPFDGGVHPSVANSRGHPEGSSRACFKILAWHCLKDLKLAIKVSKMNYLLHAHNATDMLKKGHFWISWFCFLVTWM
jgi:hypothetical protein